MKLINKDTDYAMQAIIYMAESKEGVVSVSEMSEKLEIPKHFLRKILQILHKKKVLKAYEGRNGGFSLAIPADKILLLDLIKIFQGPINLIECIFKKKICPDIRHCILKKKIDYLQGVISSELKSLSMASLSYRR